MDNNVTPDTIIDGLAVYKVGSGQVVLLLPYPHGSTQTRMAASPLTAMLVQLGKNVLTFDPPESYKSTRPADCSLQEMMDCANQTLDHFKVKNQLWWVIAWEGFVPWCLLVRIYLGPND
jgi:hypothetical protein